MSFYQHKDQRVLMFPESSNLTPLNGTKVTQNPTTYPWYEQINLVPDGFDWDLPIILKEKLYGIGAGKHPSMIVNTQQDPVDFTIETYMQDARFLSLATGAATSAGGQKIVQTITVDTYSDYVDGDQFLLYVIDASGHVKCYQVYFDVTGDDSGKPAAVIGATACRIQGTFLDLADLTATIEIALEALDEITTVTVVGSVLTITTVANTGAVPHARDCIGNTGVTTFAITTEGSSTHTVLESIDSTVKTFGLHIECDNGSEDIAVDLLGCVITSYEMTIDYSEKLIKESIGIKCPHYVISTISVYNPPLYALEPQVWSNLVESASNNVIMITAADKTPAILTGLTFMISNEIDLHPEIGYRYCQFAVSGKREITMNLIGFIQKNEIWETWYDTWSNTAGYYTNAGGRLNSEIKVERTSTYDTWQMSIYNWLIESYNLKIFPIDDKIMGIDVTFTDATPDSNGYIIDSLIISDYTAKIFYAVANSS